MNINGTYYATASGKCYTGATTCGGTTWQSSEKEIGGWYGCWNDDGSDVCIQCNGSVSASSGNEHAWYYGSNEWTCHRCGNVTGHDPGYCQVPRYRKTCGY